MLHVRARRRGCHRAITEPSADFSAERIAWPTAEASPWSSLWAASLRSTFDRHHRGPGFGITEPSAVAVTESSAEAFAGCAAGAIAVPATGTFIEIHVWAA